MRAAPCCSACGSTTFPRLRLKRCPVGVKRSVYIAIRAATRRSKRDAVAPLPARPAGGPVPRIILGRNPLTPHHFASGCCAAARRLGSSARAAIRHAHAVGNTPLCLKNPVDNGIGILHTKYIGSRRSPFAIRKLVPRRSVLAALRAMPRPRLFEHRRSRHLPGKRDPIRIAKCRRAVAETGPCRGAAEPEAARLSEHAEPRESRVDATRAGRRG